MAGKMNVNLFQLSRDVNTAPLAELLTEIAARPFEQRIRNISFGQMRLDAISEPGSIENSSPYWLLDFTK